MQRLKVVDDVRVDAALGVEVRKQHERAALGRRLGGNRLVSLAYEPQRVSADAITQGGQVARYVKVRSRFQALHPVNQSEWPAANRIRI